MYLTCHYSFKTIRCKRVKC